MMGSLMILYVTAEQETAVKQLFTRRAWMFYNLETFLSEDIKNQLLHTWELSKRNKGNSTNVSTTLLEEGKTTQTGNVTEDLDSSGKTDAKVTTGDAERKVNDPDDDKDLSTNVNLTFKSTGKPKKSRQKKSKRLHSSKKADQTRTSKEKHTVESGSRKFRGERRTRKRNLPRDDTVTTRKAKQSDINSGQNEADTESFKGASTETEHANFDGSIEKDEDTREENCHNFNVCEEGEDKSETNEDCKSTVQNVRDEGKGFNCDKCNYRTNIRSNLNRHVREIHSGVRHKCSKCNKTFKGKHDAKMHDLYGHSSGLHCKECDKTFSSVSGLRNHVKIKHKKSTLYQCKHCDMKFYYKSHYLGHVNKHLNVKPFTCNTCQKPFRYKVACHLHEKTCSRENYYNTHNSDGSLKQTPKSKFLCDICGLELTSKSGLKLHHYYTHAEDTTTVCSLCGKSFKGTYSLQRHMRNAHDNTGIVYPCPDCGKEFSQQQILKQHIKIHTKAYTSFCETCGKGFLSKFKMVEHTRMHTGEKPFSCPHCQNFKCATKTNLQKHMRIHAEGRVPRQKKEKKDQKKKPKPPEKEVKCDDVNTASYAEDVFSPLHLPSDSFTRSAGCIPDEVKYTTLPQMVLDNDRNIRPKCFSYDDMYKDQHDGSQGNTKDQSDSNPRLRTNYINEEHEYIAYQIAVKKVVEGHGERSCNTESEGGHNNYVGGIYESESQNNYVMQSHRGSHNVICSEASSYYSNDTTADTPELPQGLNILTVAMNIVNPSEY